MEQDELDALLRDSRELIVWGSDELWRWRQRARARPVVSE
jgi:hypothetical protein